MRLLFTSTVRWAPRLVFVPRGSNDMNGNGASTTCDNSVDHSQTKSRSFADAFAGKMGQLFFALN